MTPERIAALESAISVSSSHKERRELLATAIREVENDALERAAEKALEFVEQDSAVAVDIQSAILGLKGKHQ